MLSALFQALLRGARRSRTSVSAGRFVAPTRFAPSLQMLEGREMPAVTAVFNAAAGGSLSVFGDGQDNAITISRDAAGTILVNGGAVTMKGGNPTVANTASISVFGAAGNDTIRLDEVNGALPKASLHGGAGMDVLTGGSGDDQLFGGAGSDTLLGKGGDDLLFGGAGDDVLTGGAATDQVFGQAGDDRMIWNPGDGTDLNEGGSGNDTAEVNGGNGAEVFTITANGTRVRFDRVTPGAFSMDIGTTENLLLNANGGDDTITASNGLAGLINLTLDGGAGNDTITGGDGIDRIAGGDGNDTINGGKGNDQVDLGAGDDTFVWNPGDASDTVEGGDGSDSMVFNGAVIDELFEISANGTRARLTRNIGGVTMDLNGIEGIDLNGQGGADTMTVNDLTGTDLGQLNLDLGNADGQTTTVVVKGTNEDDAIAVAGDANGVVVTGLAAQVTVTGSEADWDLLQINALAGDDVVNASGLGAGAILLSADGGEGDDELVGSAGSDLLSGGNGDDVLMGGPGQDLVDGGAGENVVIQ